MNYFLKFKLGAVSRGCAAVFSGLLVLVSAIAVLRGTGSLSGGGNLTHTGSEGNWIRVVVLFLLIASSLRCRRLFLFAVLPLLSLMALYFPVGMNFGLPNAGQIVSALNTDALEAKEFLKVIPAWQYVMPLLVIGALLVASHLVERFNIRVFATKGFVIFIGLILVFLSGDLKFFTQGFRYCKEVIVGLQQLNDAQNVKSEWKILSATPAYRNYVLVVGESNRRDYMHAYGYPVENAPFMESRGQLLEGFTAVADYTIPSLQKDLTLTRQDQPVNYALNVVDLASLAGFETFWFSNQGHIDSKNTPITALANRAETKAWLKTGARTEENSADLELLSLVKSELNKPRGKPRFFVLHLMGSHSSVCERIHAPFAVPVAPDAGLGDAYCYETTMRQTDYFLRELDSLLKASGETYSILYFADHGVSHNQIQGRLVMNHANPANHHRDVPLYCVSSDVTELTRYKVRRFASNLTEGVAAWLRVKTEQLPAPRDLFLSDDDADEYGVMEELRNRRNDPPLDVR